MPLPPESRGANGTMRPPASKMDAARRDELDALVLAASEPRRRRAAADAERARERLMCVVTSIECNLRDRVAAVPGLPRGALHPKASRELYLTLESFQPVPSTPEVRNGESAASPDPGAAGCAPVAERTRRERHGVRSG